MNENDATRLRHMWEYAQEATQFVAGKTRDSLEQDTMLARALSYSLGVVGEAASRISPETQAEIPQIPWRSAIAMRNFLFHVYFSVEYDILWQTVTQSIPPLIAELEKLLPPPNENGV